MPRTRWGVIWRSLLAGIIVVGFAAGATATTGLLEVNTAIVVPLRQHARAYKGLTLPKPGKPETILLIGSDHRAGSASYEGSRTDTMLLMRIDDNSSTINVMSVPRDLDVLGPTGIPVKLNSIYSSEGGPSGLIKQLKAQVFPGLQVNHVIDTSFTGFSNLIDAIGCVYTDVDRRYYNVSGPGVDNFSSIDLQPGYQKLCGGVHNTNGYGALPFVRYRETDNDIVRNARQQDFIRWTKEGFGSGQLLAERTKLTTIFGRNTTPDKSLATEDGVLDLFNLIVDADKLSLKTITFPEYSGACDSSGSTPCYVYPCATLTDCGYTQTTIGQPTAATEAAYKKFVTPTAAPAGTKNSAGVTTKVAKAKRVKAKLNLYGLAADPGDGASQAAQLEAKGNVGFPIFYPKAIVPSQSGVSDTYCFSITANCDLTALEPESAYTGSYPRRYKIAGPGGKPYAAYVMTLVINQGQGLYYTVQGTTWTNPPILNHPSKVVHINGHELYEYDDGSKISLVATKTPRGVYWISNTLANYIPNGQMINMAATLTRYTGKSSG